MKRINYLLATAAILAVVGCAKEAEKEIVNPESNKVTLRASVEDTDTRVSIGNDYAFAFQSGDKVSVLTDGGEPVEFETSDSGTTANFEGSLGEGESVGSYALYPASDNHMADGDEVLFFMNDELTWKADESYMPMLGKVEDGSITFKAVGGVMKLIVYNIPSGAAYLQFTATNKKISGDFEIADASVDNPVIVTATKNASDDTMFIDFSEDYSVNKVFYIPLPTGTIDGFTISFLDGNFDDIEGTSKTTIANLNVTRNKIILAPALNIASAEEVVLWSEDFKGYSADDVPEEGTGYGDAVVSYSVENGAGATKVYNETYAGGPAPEILVGKNGGSFTAEGIPTAGATSAILTYTTNNDNNAVSTSTEGVTIGTRSKSGNVVTYPITISSSVDAFDLCISNSAANTRIDNIVLKATVGTAPTKPTIIVGRESETISVGALNASINGVKLENPLDNLGITASTEAEWLTVAFTAGTFETGAKLTATANSYNHESDARTATVTLKATGVTKTVSFKQNPTLVNNPSALTIIPGDKTFTVEWEGDSKAASYVAYYSATDLSEGDPATDGIEMTVSNTGNAYSAVPEQTLVNRTTYYVYVKVGTVASEYAEKYGIAKGWATTTAVPVGEVEVETVDAPYSQMFKAGGQGLFVEDIVENDGPGEHIWNHNANYGMVASGRVGSNNYYTEAWLYSPKIQIPATITNPYVSFKHIGNYYTNTANMKADLKIYVREVGGEWIQMDVPYPAGNTFNADWTVVDYALTPFVGKTVQFRWMYTSTSTRCGTYEMDEFKVYDKPVDPVISDKSVTYTVESTSAVTSSGDVVAGSSAAYSSTYSSKCQLTGGNSMTLTLSGFSGKKIKGLTLSMKSNKSSGAGYMYMATKSGSTETSIATIGSSSNPLTFDKSAWNGAYTTSYVDVDVPVSETTIASGEDIVIYIKATANSLYCESFTLIYE